MLTRSQAHNVPERTGLRYEGEQAIRSAVPSCVPILAYHAIIERSGTAAGAWSAEHAVSLDQFRKHMDILVAEGWNAILPEALEQASLPPKSVVITFDDGHCSDVIAARELTQRGLPATFFVTWTHLDCAGFLSRHQVVELEGQGFRIGSHGLGHVPLAELSSAEIRRQLIDSKRRLESLLDTAVNVSRFRSAPITIKWSPARSRPATGRC